jgi:hypothetical protein
MRQIGGFLNPKVLMPASTALPTGLTAPGASPALDVNITNAMASVDVMHHGRKVTIMRNQNNTVNPESE